jgi:protein-disulfide isomerase
MLGMPSNRTPAPVPVEDDDETPERALTNKQRRKLSKREQAQYSQEMVAVRKREKRARAIRRRVTVIIAVVAAIAVVGTGTFFIVQANVRAGEVGPANMLSDGILLTGSTDSTTQQATLTPVTTDALQAGAKPVATNLKTYAQTANIVLYLDYAAPRTSQFLAANDAEIENWLAAGYITLEIHPIATVNSYSELAANAIACVAATDPSQVLALHEALMKASSAKKATTKSSSALSAMVTKAGITDTTVAGCVSGNKYGNWVAAATQRATHGGVLNSNTKSVKKSPLVVVNKEAYTGKLTDNTAFTTFISNTFADAAAAGSSDSTATATPTPTPTP